MNVGKLNSLAKSLRNGDEADALGLLAQLQAAFREPKPLQGLPVQHTDASMETRTADGQTYQSPHVSFEITRLLGSDYATVIVPEIRDEQLAVLVRTYRLLDGKGLESTSRQPLDDFPALGIVDVALTPKAMTSIGTVAQQAAVVATNHHAALIERLAVPKELALRVARQSWPNA